MTASGDPARWTVDDDGIIRWDNDYFLDPRDFAVRKGAYDDLCRAVFDRERHEGCTHTTDTLRQAAWQFNEAVSLLREAQLHVAPATSLLYDIDAALPAIQAALVALAGLTAEGPDHE